MTAPRLTAWQRLRRLVAYVIRGPGGEPPSRLRRVLSWCTAVVAVLGIGMTAYPWVGHVYPPGYRHAVEKLIEWSNFLSDLDTNRLQDQLEKGFLALGDPRLAKEGDPLTRIEIPKLGVNTIVVQGTTLPSLAAGAGHYSHTPLPGEKGNVAIAGHRTTHGRPFNKIDQLRPGDAIILTTPVGRFTYKVSRPPWITSPYDWSMVAKSTQPLLTLTACHPKGSARQRIVARAELVRSEAIARIRKPA